MNILFKKAYLSIGLCFVFTAQSAQKQHNTSKNDIIITTSTDGRSITMQHTKDVISFVLQRDYLLSNSRGLKDQNILHNLLNDQNYVEVMKYVWGEKDTTKRIKWLREYAEKGHVICMFELSKELAALKKKEEAYLWYQVGIMRARQDALCCIDESVHAGVAMLMLHYGEFIERMLSSMGTLTQQEGIELVALNGAKVLKQLRAFQHYPYPHWICYHGLAACAPLKKDVKDTVMLKPATQWATIRNDYIRQQEESLKLLQEDFYKVQQKPVTHSLSFPAS